MSLTIVGIITALGRVVDAVTDPLIAGASDKYTHKLGKRIPFMRYSAIPFALTTVLIFCCPIRGESVWNIVWLAVTMVLFYVCMTAYCTPYNALIPVLGREQKDRIISTYISLTYIVGTGGAGAGFGQFAAMVKHLLPYIERGEVALAINFGDHKDVYDKLVKETGSVDCVKFFNDYEALKKYNADVRHGKAAGLVAVVSDDIFEAVYSTNLLMRNYDFLVTKPSELAYYHVPKIFMRHIGGHEVYGAIYGREIGDAFGEYPDEKSMNEMLDRIIADRSLVIGMCDRIDDLRSFGVYNGGYECVKAAAGIKEE